MEISESVCENLMCGNGMPRSAYLDFGEEFLGERPSGSEQGTEALAGVNEQRLGGVIETVGSLSLRYGCRIHCL
jgi:hypothetical protein